MAGSFTRAVPRISSIPPVQVVHRLCTPTSPVGSGVYSAVVSRAHARLNGCGIAAS
ncbi:Uncharacterised protein [Mycobacteroides abscessus subsp. abscessus]|nr:Uncharacterised protein [Mycobacteroides abscessus subsp. abscessus]